MSESKLPTEKSTPTQSPEQSKVLLYGPPKIGKSTLAANLDPERTLFLASEPGLGALSVYQTPITSWSEFRAIGGELAKDPGKFTTIVIDTVDELYRMCSEETCQQHGVAHPGDVGYGKVWGAISDEFRLRIGKLASLGFGVWFISHSKDIEIESRVGKITKTVPTVAGQARTFLIGFCDFILLATSELEKEGERRVLRTVTTENYEAGGRWTLRDPLPLDAGALQEEMKRVMAGSDQGKKAKAEKKEAVAA